VGKLAVAMEVTRPQAEVTLPGEAMAIPAGA
jgi:hypothetical protein